MKRLAVLFILLVMLAGSADAAIDKARLRWVRSQPTVDSIVVEGNNHISDSEIRSRLYSLKRNAWRAIKGERRSRVQRETRGRDTLEVKYLYLSDGFLDVTVKHSFEPIGADSGALVRIVINEGERYRYGDKQVEGQYEKELGWRLVAIGESLAKGSPVNPFQLTDAEFEMKAFLANRGYPYATVKHTLDTSPGLDNCLITFTIYADSLVRFGDVEVVGAQNYPEKAASRELKIKPGRIYRRDNILESQRRLFESGYYTTFQLQQKDSVQNRLQPDFTLKVRERKPHYVTFKTGAAQSEYRDLQWDLSANYGRRNFLGTRRFDVLADYSFSVGKKSRLVKHRYRLRYTEPWFLGIRMPLTLTAEVQPRTKKPVENLVFDKRSWAIGAAVTKWFGRKVRTSVGLEYQNVKLSGASEDTLAIARELQDNAARRKLYFTYRRDSRNDLFLPSLGSVSELSGDYFGGFLGGDVDFFKLQASWSRYQVVWPGWIAASRIKLGWAEEFGSTEAVPLDEAMYLGGANTVRGFAENTLGPLASDGTPVGARYTVVLNQEFRWKTIQVLSALPGFGSFFKTLPLWQSVFFDAGNGFRNKEEISFNNLALTYGTGVQIVSPAGPIRIDYARILDTDTFDVAYRWHFTILYAF
ncbi:MAG: BamA/TamA family outer membrane protein [candidate division Zixibacteria bacterium]|nr:BamA/TamA family outer membrane protein [candidate division Zixibacteria bacterium]